MKAVVNAEGRVHVLDETGQPRTVEQADLPAALDAGYQLEGTESVSQRHIQQERSTLGQKALTAGESALSGATFGISDAALTAGLGDEYRQAALERRQVNPYTALAGNVVGSLAPLLASGGTSLAARGVAGIGAPARFVSGAGHLAEHGTLRMLEALGYTGASAVTRAAAKAAAMGAAGATEGAFLGLGNSLSEAALGGTEWTAEKALASVKTNALYGLGAGAGVSLLGSAVKGATGAVLERMTGGQTLREALTDYSQKRAFKSVSGNYQKWYERATNFGENPERIPRIGQKLIDAAEETGTDLGKLDDAARMVKGKADEAGTKLQTIAKDLDDAGVKIDGKPVLDKVRDQVAKIREVKLGKYQQVADQIEAQIEPFAKMVEGHGDLGVFKVAGREPVTKHGWMHAERKLEPIKGAGQHQTFTDFWKLRQKIDSLLFDDTGKRLKGPLGDALGDVRATFDDALTAAVEHSDDAAAGAAASPLKQAWKQAKEDYSDYHLASDAADFQIRAREKNRVFSPTDYATTIGGGLFGGIISAATGDGDISSSLQGIATGALLGMGHKYIRERGPGAIASLIGGMVKYDHQLKTTAASLTGRAIHDSLHAIDTPKPAVKAIIEGAARGTATRALDHFASVQASVADHQRDPMKASTELARAVEPFSRGNPEVATQMGVMVVQDMQYLAAETPKAVSRASKSLTPHAEQTLVPAVSKPSLVRKAKALSEPASVLADLAKGRVNMDAIRAIKDRRPELYNELRTEVMQMAASSDKPLPYHRRVMLSLAFEFAGDASMRPGQIAEIQSTNVPTEPNAPAPAQAGADVSEAAQGMQTPSQEAIGI